MLEVTIADIAIFCLFVLCVPLILFIANKGGKKEKDDDI